MNTKKLKHLANLVSRDIQKWKQNKKRISKEVYAEHHSMLVGTLGELKVMINEVKDK